jgi:hypothetical protein
MLGGVGGVANEQLTMNNEQWSVLRAFNSLFTVRCSLLISK